MKHIICVIDRSGSMERIADEMNGGLKTWLEETKKMDENVLITSVLFDHEYEVTNKRVPITEVKPESLRIVPRGMTRLNDALGQALQYSKKSDDGGLVLIVTDGVENDSREYTFDQIKRRIKKLTNRGVTFQYLSASVDAFRDSKKYGISRTSTVVFSAIPGAAGAETFRSNVSASSVYLGNENKTPNITIQGDADRVLTTLEKVLKKPVKVSP